MSDLGETHLCSGLCLSVFMSLGFPFDFYCRKTVIFLEPGVPHTKPVIIFHGVSAILQSVELNLKKMIRFCSAVFSPRNFELLFHNFVHGFDFQFSTVFKLDSVSPLAVEKQSFSVCTNLTSRLKGLYFSATLMHRRPLESSGTVI